MKLQDLRLIVTNMDAKETLPVSVRIDFNNERGNYTLADITGFRQYSDAIMLTTRLEGCSLTSDVDTILDEQKRAIARRNEENAQLRDENERLKAKLDEAEKTCKCYESELESAEQKCKKLQERADAPIDGLSGVGLIMQERSRQIEQEGYDAEHDHKETISNLANAAISYLTYDSGLLNAEYVSRGYWPWSMGLYKPRDRKRNLVRAGALIAAAIDRLNVAEREGCV